MKNNLVLNMFPFRKKKENKKSLFIYIFLIFILIICSIFIVLENKKALSRYLPQESTELDISHTPKHSLQIVTLLLSNSDNLSQENLMLYTLTLDFVEGYNKFLGKEVFNPITQGLNPSDLFSWYQSQKAHIGFLPTLVYKSLLESGNLKNHSTIAFLKGIESSLVIKNYKNKDKNFDFQKHLFKRDDQIFLDNEYNNGGTLLINNLISLNKSVEFSNYKYYLNSDTQVQKFINHTGEETIYGFFDINLLNQFQGEEYLIIKDDFLPNISGHFLVVENTFKKQTQKYLSLFLKNLFVKKENIENNISQEYYNRLTQTIVKPDEINKITDKINNSYQGNQGLPTLNYKNLIQRFEDVNINGPTSIQLFNAGARTPYAMFILDLFFSNIVEKTALKDNIIIFATSGGTIVTLGLVISERFNYEKRDIYKSLSNIIQYLEPKLAGDIIDFINQNLIAFIIIISLIILHFLFSSFYYIKKEPIFKNILISFISTVSLGLISPSIHWSKIFILIFLILIVGLIIELFFLRKKPILGLIIVCLYVFCLINLIKYPFYNNSILEKFNLQKTIQNTLALNKSPECKGIEDKEEFSSCLFNIIEIPFVFGAFEANKAKLIKFYFIPPEKGYPVPNSIDWVDLNTCPEKLIDLAEAAASLPFVFKHREINCGGTDYVFIDGGIVSDAMVSAARELGIKNHILLMNNKAELNQNFLPKSSIYEKSNLFDLQFMGEALSKVIFYETNKQLADGLNDLMFISNPQLKLIGTVDFSGGTIENGDYVYPEQLINYAIDDFFSNKGIFSQIAGKVREYDVFYNNHKKQILEFRGR